MSNSKFSYTKKNAKKNTKLPGYEETLERGDPVQGQVVRVEKVENITINGRNPLRVIFRYGDGQEGSLTIAVDERATEGQPLKIRLMGEHAYPENLRPLARPTWLTWIVVGIAVFGSLLIARGIFRLLLVTGLLVAGGHAWMKKKGQSPHPRRPESA